MNRIVLWGLLALIVAGCQNVPVTGRKQLQMVPEQQERRMGLSSYKEILEKEKLNLDPVLNERVPPSAFCCRIHACMSPRPTAWG